MGVIKRFAGETLVYGFANVFSRVFALLLIPLYTNYLDKIEYSNLIMLQSFFTLVTFLLALNSGVFFYYYEKKESVEQRQVFTSWFYYQIVLSLLIILAAYWFREQVGSLFIISESSREEIYWAIALITFQLIPYTFNITNVNRYRIDRKPRSVLVLTFLESFFTLCIVFLLFTFHKKDIMQVILAQIIARSIVALLFFQRHSFYVNLKFYSSEMLKKLLSFSWPFFITSSFAWAIVSVDKFIGNQQLTDKEEIALLALAMQLSVPIMVLADMIRMAIGPFIMQHRHEDSSKQDFQKVFDLSVFAGMFVYLLLLAFAPFAVLILSNESFLPALSVLPLIAFASVLSIVFNQVAVGFSLLKKNTFIMYATLLGGSLGVALNYFFMPQFGFIVSGFSQVISYALMIIILYVLSHTLSEKSLDLTKAMRLIVFTLLCLVLYYGNIHAIINGAYIWSVLSGLLGMLVLVFLFFRYQNISLQNILPKRDSSP